jgi:hypothetical protein
MIAFAKIPDYQERKALRVAHLRREAVGLSRQLERQLVLTPTDDPIYKRAVIALRSCCRHLVARKFYDGSLEPLAGPTCKHKVCPICNALSARRIRAGYWRFFQAHPELLQQYSFMHLTLTLPHRAHELLTEVYGRLIKAFNELRKDRNFKRMVFAGVRNVETTQGANGWHVHIHALLLLYSIQRSRNQFYSFLLLRWNQLTTPKGKHKPLPPRQRAGIAAGLAYLKAPEREALLNALDARGATSVGLESLYILLDGPGGKLKKYVNARNPEQMMGGILECIKYQFEPFALKDEDGTYNTDMIWQILPGIYKKRLYAAFGEFYGKGMYAAELRQMLNPDDEVTADIEAFGREAIVHPETGEVLSSYDYSYVAVKTTGIHRQGGQLVAEGRVTPLLANNLKEAMKALIEWQVGEQTQSKSKL